MSRATFPFSFLKFRKSTNAIIVYTVITLNKEKAKVDDLELIEYARLVGVRI